MTPEEWEQIGQVYEAAKELPPSERAAFLDHACAGDEALRREVDSLLATDQSVGDFIAAPALKDAAALLTGELPGAMIGKQLGHYQLLSLVGTGGMGEVYAARDTRLGRKVAVKLLPAILSQDEDRLRRFEQESRAIGMLNHPNILTVHDVGTYEGASYIVSELLQGETLREQMKDGAIAPRRAVDFALQITRGLAAAHERGIMHRDLKPENLFITRDGRVKILDFGLAKLAQPPFGRSDTSWTPGPGDATNPGRVMGTVGYMAPEQLRNEDVDHRADIFAFGVVLHEMLAGAPPFRAQSAADTISAILKQDTPELPAPLSAHSPALARVVWRCLEKRPEQRFQSASDLGFALEALTSPSLGSSGSWLGAVVTKPIVRFRLNEGRIGWIVAGVFALVSVLLATAYFSRPAIRTEAIRFLISPPERAARVGDPVISPDGRRLAFVATAEGKTLLWVRPMGSLVGQPLPGTEGASGPFWSPEGQSIGFFAQGKLKKIALSGEPPVTLGDAPANRGGTWSGDRKPIPWVQTQFNDTNARFSPDSRWIAWTSDESGKNEVYVQAFQNARGRWKISSQGGDHPRWRSDGKELFYIAADRKLMSVELKGGAGFDAAVPKPLFDLRSVRAVGSNYAVVDEGRKFHLVTTLEDPNASPATVVLNWTADLNR